MRRTDLTTAKATGERAAKVLVPRREIGPIEAELLDVCSGDPSRIFDVSDRAQRCVYDAARYLFGPALPLGYSFMQIAPDIATEALVAAQELGL